MVGIAVDAVDSEFEEVLLKDGERAELIPPTPCSEVSDVFLLKVGVNDLWSAFMELEVEVLRSGLCGGLCVTGDKLVWLTWKLLAGDPTRSEGGRAVAEAVASERRFRGSDRSLFVVGGNGADKIDARSAAGVGVLDILASLSSAAA